MTELEELVSALNSSMVDPHQNPQRLLDKLEEFGIVYEGDGWNYEHVED